MELRMTTLTLLSSLAEPPVAVVDKVAKPHCTNAVSKAYLDYLYSDEGGHLVVRHHYCLGNPVILKEIAARLPLRALFTDQKLAGDWEKAQKKHFAQGGSLTRSTSPGVDSRLIHH